MTHYKIVFNDRIVNDKIVTKKPIVIESDNGIILSSGRYEITTSVEGKVEVFKDVSYVVPFHYNEG